MTPILSNWVQNRITAPQIYKEKIEKILFTRILSRNSLIQSFWKIVVINKRINRVKVWDQDASKAFKCITSRYI